MGRRVKSRVFGTRIMVAKASNLPTTTSSNTFRIDKHPSSIFCACLGILASGTFRIRLE